LVKDITPPAPVEGKTSKGLSGVKKKLRGQAVGVPAVPQGQGFVPTKKTEPGEWPGIAARKKSMGSRGQTKGVRNKMPSKRGEKSGHGTLGGGRT